MKHKKIAAALLAALVILQPPCAAPAPAFGLSAPDIIAVKEWGASDWFGVLAHVSAFAGLAYWVYSGVSQALDALSGLDSLWDFLSLMLRLGLIPRWYYELAPEPPGAYSI